MGDDLKYAAPASQNDFEIAIICALPKEKAAVLLLLDDLWDGRGNRHRYARAPGDYNTYRHGRIGRFNVVIVLLDTMGKVPAAGAAVNIRRSYPNLSLALIIGICAGVPLAKGREVILGDVVISNVLIHRDFGRQYPDRFEAKAEVEDVYGRPNRNIRSLLKSLEEDNRPEVEEQAAEYLRRLQEKHDKHPKRESELGKYKYPGADKDKLFEDSYEHKHHDPTLNCGRCTQGSICEESREIECDELGCDDNLLVPRQRLTRHRAQGSSPLPQIHIGRMGSGDSVIRSAQHRKALAAEGVIGIEMEGAGVWDELPCILIKGVCDYADSHKGKGWQYYAAATAASVAKAVLDEYPGSGRVSGDAHGPQEAMNPLVDSARHQEMQQMSEKDQQCLKHLRITDPRHDKTRIEQTKGGHYRVKFSLQGMPTSNNFVPRPSDITDIEKSLLPHHQKSQGRNVFVLHGLGGIGKTQLAVNFARQYKHAFSAIFWLDGTSEDSLKQSFASCAKRIPKDQIPENISSPKTGDEVDLNDIVEHVQEWLAEDDNVYWLLIFDNVDLDHTQGEIPGAYDIRKYLRSDHGAVLITSRLSKLAQLGESKLIKPTDLDLSKKIFEKWYGKELMMDDDAEELLDSKLGGLPLALAQAAAYIGEANIPIAKYIDLYEKQWDKLLRNTDSDLLDYDDRSVWTTWTISFNAIETRDKNAGNLLRLWAFLDNREMWHSLLQVARNDQEQWPKWLCDIACDEVKFLNIATLLLRYSMIETRESEQSSYSMHPVVHEWISHIQDDDGKRVFLRLAVMLIGFSVPHRTTKNYWVLQRRLLPHAEGCLRWMGKLEGEYSVEDITISHATYNLGLLYSDQGRLKKAETMYQRALEGSEKALGPDHTSTLDTANNLGLLYSHQGRLKEAETMYQRALEGKEKALGPDHTSTLNTVCSLGNLYLNQGRLKEAEIMYQRALEGYEKALGPDHTSTLGTVCSLGNLYLNQGRLKEAEIMYQRALEGYEKALGPDHTSTLGTVCSLGNLYLNQGRLKEAEIMYQRALEGYEKALGPDHTSTLGTVRSLGNLYLNQGRLKEAEIMYQPALEGYEKALGSDHTSTLDTVRSLGNLYMTQGRLQEAEAMYQRALEGYEKALGPDHTSTLSTVHNWGILYMTQGRLQEAETMYQRALEGKEKALGPDHTSTLNTVCSLGNLYLNQGRLKEAETMYQRALEGYEKALGPDHTSTLTTVNNLGLLYSNQGRLKEAEIMYQRALEGKKALAPDHTSTLDTVRSLGNLYMTQGRL
ncbi:Pfs, NB-ARC and TPR domain protein [Sordaria sp. MPI-SDFR-AT-0083]|nr:Pfs, NB-ARC and TPR domain protein [Sordaria sp. MPI-SDFR-AT-0083]